MILNVTTSPQRVIRSFDRRVFLLIRAVTTSLVLRIGHEQSEVTGDDGTQSPNDGVLISQAGTNPPNYPFGTWWKGDFWFSGSIVGTAVLINTGVYEDVTS
jgi:hypothetical protein